MKDILLSILFFANIQCQTEPVVLNYSISIWNYDYSMAHTMYYHIDNRSLVVKSISGIENEKDSIFLKRKISKEEEKILTDFLSSFKINNLKNSYVNPLVDDGDRKKINLTINSESKQVEVANMYDEQLAQLFIVINQIVDEHLRIQYNN